MNAWFTLFTRFWCVFTIFRHLRRTLSCLQISQGSARTHYRWSEHFLHSFVARSSQYMCTCFYWNRFMFDRHGAQNRLAQFFWDSVHIWAFDLRITVKVHTQSPVTKSNSVRGNVRLMLVLLIYLLKIYMQISEFGELFECLDALQALSAFCSVIKLLLPMHGLRSQV